MKFRRTICLILCLILSISSFGVIHADEVDTTSYNSCRGLDAQMSLGGSEKLLETSKAVVLYERNTDTLIYCYEIDETIYPSSMVKLMTALVALQHGDPEEIVTVTRSALDSVEFGAVSANLVRGEELKLKDLLYCMMVASANDASAVIAEHIGGSQAGFVSMMNEMAREMGLTGTHFSNVHGLHDDDTYTTARDVLKILDIGLNNPQFREMYETVTYTVPATNKTDERVISTTNKMMTDGKYFDECVTGGKTGATDEAGRCLTVSANIGDMELIAIVMGAKAKYSSDGSYLTHYGSFEEMAQLLDFAQAGFECRQLFYADQVIAQYAVANGNSNVVTTPADESYSVVPKNLTYDQLQWVYDVHIENLTAPIAQGQVITTMEVWYGSVCLAQTDLIAMNAVAVDTVLEEDRITEQQKQEQRHGEVLALIVGIILGLILLGFVGLIVYRFGQTMLIKARIRRRRRNRRRNRNARME